VIVSHEHRFIFIKTRKTAGSSIEQFLLPHLGPDDTIRSFRARNERGRFNPLPELASHPDRSNARLTLRQFARGEKYVTHMPAWRARNRVGRAVWEDYTTFCFERDPWDKLVSFYHWRTKDEAEPLPFDEWVRTTPGLSGWDLYTIDDRVAVDVVGRFEHLEEDLAAVLERIGLDIPVDLPQAKSGVRPEQDTVSYTPDLDAWVAEHFRREIELMGYERPPRR